MCKKIDREKENKRLHEKKEEESGWKGEKVRARGVRYRGQEQENWKQVRPLLLFPFDQCGSSPPSSTLLPPVLFSFLEDEE